MQNPKTTFFSLFMSSKSGLGRGGGGGSLRLPEDPLWKLV